MLSVRRFHLFLLASVAGITLISAPVAVAAPILGASVIVQSTGNVTATFVGYSAAFTNELYLDSPSNSLGIIFTNHVTPVGSVVSLGTFAAGTELIFRIHVQNTGNDFSTGPGSRNPDGVPHAVVDDQFAPNTSYVGFEDSFGGGDQDYDDLRFSFTNTAAANPVPEPAGFWLIGSGLGLILLRWAKP